MWKDYSSFLLLSFKDKQSPLYIITKYIKLYLELAVLLSSWTPYCCDSSYAVKM